MYIHIMIIGFTGKAGVGKDTAANYLSGEYKNIFCVSFAGPLKAACRHIFNMTNEQMDDRTLKEKIDPRWGFSPRTALQFVGTDLLREQTYIIAPEIDRSIWIKNMEQRINKIPAGMTIVITDVRFADEMKFIKNRGGYVIRIVRDANDGTTHGHASEAQEFSADKIIKNNGTREDMYKKIDKIYSEIIDA